MNSANLSGNSLFTNGTGKSTNDQKLSKEEQKEVKELERIDRQVKSRELTHRAVAGSYARESVYFDYVTRPDGKKYAEEVISV